MECEVPSISQEESFEELLEGMQTQQYWVRFFMRPCCPAPGEAAARFQTERLKDELSLREDFTEEQRDQLISLIDERLQWYLSLPVRRTV